MTSSTVARQRDSPSGARRFRSWSSRWSSRQSNWPVRTQLDRRHVPPDQPGSNWSRPVRRWAPAYGSGGWGFEPLAARSKSQGQPVYLC